MTDIISIQHLSLSGSSMLFMYQLGYGILQPPTKNDHDKLTNTKHL